MRHSRINYMSLNIINHLFHFFPNRLFQGDLFSNHHQRFLLDCLAEVNFKSIKPHEFWSNYDHNWCFILPNRSPENFLDNSTKREINFASNIFWGCIDYRCIFRPKNWKYCFCLHHIIAAVHMSTPKFLKKFEYLSKPLTATRFQSCRREQRCNWSEFCRNSHP